MAWRHCRMLLQASSVLPERVSRRFHYIIHPQRSTQSSTVTKSRLLRKFVVFSLSHSESGCHTLPLVSLHGLKKMIDKKNILEDESKSSHQRNKRPHFRKEKPEKADGGQKMRRLNERNFLPGWKDLPEFFLRLGSFLETLPPVWRCPPVNHNRHGARPLKGRSVEFAFLPASVCLCFSKIKAHALKKTKQKKKTVQFPRWRKPFHNFKYNNFLSGMMPGIIHMYLAFIYGFLFPP